MMQKTEVYFGLAFESCRGDSTVATYVQTKVNIIKSQEKMTEKVFFLFSGQN